VENGGSQRAVLISLVENGTKGKEKVDFLRENIWGKAMARG